VLASLLPGLRELRTPVAVGYIFLLDLWLVLADYLPRKASDGLVGNVFELGGLLGKGAVFAALTFSAYLIGCLNRIVPDSMSTSIVFGELSKQLPGPWLLKAVLPDSFMMAFWELKQRQGQAPPMEKNGVSFTTSEGEIRSILKTLVMQRSDLRTKLLIADKELYGEYDRFESEAEFRMSIVIPLAALFVILALKLNPFWVLGLLSLVSIFLQGVSREFGSLAVLLRAILVGKIKASPAPEVKTISAD
jgi:hypothetical protein